MSAAFDLLHPKIQEAIYRLQWEELRPLQVDAIRAVMQTSAHLLLSSATASGKTEAAFLPILSIIAAAPAASVQVIYVSPLKALINDQFGRLEQLCEFAEIPVHRWHGDVSSSQKERLRKEPGGVLLITPESLESQFVNHDRHLKKLYKGLQFIVIDELHAFLDNVRGIHLRSLLARLELQAEVKARRLGLSATLGSYSQAQAFLDPSAPDQVLIVEDAGTGRELRISLKSFYDEDIGDEAEASPAAAVQGLSGVALDISQRFRTDANLIFCNRRMDAEVLADKLHRITEREHWARDPFIVHHGSLSRELREEAEQGLKSGQTLTALCTSTLEMGIDLGAVRAVGQVGSPWSVASLVQRLGRSGRKPGQPQVLRMYALDPVIDAKSKFVDRLHVDLIRAIAMVELHLEKWLEPPAPLRRHYSTFIHQTLSILKQTGGALATTLHERLCEKGVFTRLSKSDFTALLRSLASHEIIEQTPPGELILAPQGERIVESRDFYAAFAASVDYLVEHLGEKLGLLALDCVPPVDEYLIFAGRRWQVEEIEHQARRVTVKKAQGWKRPRFIGRGGELHARVIQKMREVLAGDVSYTYLDAAAVQRLQEARKVFSAAGLCQRNFVPSAGELLWFPWCGGSTSLALHFLAKAKDLQVEWSTLLLRFPRASLDELRSVMKSLAETQDLAALLPKELEGAELLRDRFDNLVPMELLQNAYVDECLDLAGAHQLALQVAQAGPEPPPKSEA